MIQDTKGRQNLDVDTFVSSFQSDRSYAKDQDRFSRGSKTIAG